MKLLTLAYEDGITIGEALNVSVTGMIVVLLIFGTAFGFGSFAFQSGSLR